jgi:dienelactone hydrolase
MRSMCLMFMAMIGCATGCTASGGAGAPVPAEQDARGSQPGPPGGGTGGAIEPPPGSTTNDAATMTAPDGAPTADVVAPTDAPGPPSDIPAATEPTREAFLAMLRAIAQPLPPLAPMLMPATTTGGVVRQDFSFASTPTWRVTGTLRHLATATGKLPVAIVLHETGADRDSGNVLDIANALVTRGFLAVAISGRYFGPDGNNDRYIAAIKAAYASPGHDYPFLYDTAWDAMRLIDYLVTRDDVDPLRIGMTGISKGGMETTLAAAADPRVAAAAPIIGVQSFKWGLENNAFTARALSLDDAVPNPTSAASVRMFYDKVAPGLVDRFDGPDVLPLVAPRPLMIIAGTQDPRNAMGGVQVVMDRTTPAYARAGAADHLKLFTANVGHDGAYAPFHQAAVMWLDQWLGKSTPPGK